MEKKNKYLTEYLEYLRDIKKYSDNTIRAYKQDIKQFFRYFALNKVEIQKQTIRDFMASPQKLKYKKVIHGHYAKPLQDILYNLIEKKGYVLNIDNGCVYTHREGMGNLFILNLNNLSYHIQPCLDNHNYEDSLSKRRYYQNKS